jgi:SAM-dependent methyltransferase
MLKPTGAESGSHRAHWDATYGRTAPTQLSWHQAIPALSLELIRALELPGDAAIIDVGGGASTLVDHLLADGFRDVSVLDVSAVALETTRRRLGDAGQYHVWLADVLTWRPERAYDLWHDRAVFHFLINPADRQAYLDVLGSALRPGGYAIIATFALDGPQRCSGLPVARYDADELDALLEGSFEVVESRREQHTTPAGVMQPFTWVVARALP